MKIISKTKIKPRLKPAWYSYFIVFDIHNRLSESVNKLYIYEQEVIPTFKPLIHSIQTVIEFSHALYACILAVKLPSMTVLQYQKKS